MKRIVLICCMFFAVGNYVVAQQATVDVAAPVSKNDFIEKVKDFNKLLTEGDIAAADKKFNEITPMIHAELKVVRYKIRDSQNQSEKKQLEEHTTRQRTLFGEISRLKRDMANSKASLVNKLNEFAETIL